MRILTILLIALGLLGLSACGGGGSGSASASGSVVAGVDTAAQISVVTTK